jgi:hypothetical protein
VRRRSSSPPGAAAGPREREVATGHARVRRPALLVPAAAAALAVVPVAAPGVLTETTTATPSFSVTLNGANQTPTYTLPITVVDSRGTGAGWNLTITTTQLATSGGQKLPTSASSVSSVSTSCSVSPCTNPVNGIAYPVTVPAGSTPPTAVKLYDAAVGSGLGTFVVTPTVKVAVAANSFKGTYTSTITLAIATGP